MPTTLENLDQFRADLSAAILRLNHAGLGTEPPAVQARRYLSKVNSAIKVERGGHSEFIAGAYGENGYAPGIRATLRDADYWVRTFGTPMRDAA